MRRLLLVLGMVMVAVTGLAQTVQIGTDEIIDSNPFYTGYGYDFSADLYPSNKIGMTGYITDIAFWHAGGMSLKSTPVKIYFKAVTDATLPSLEWATLKAGATLVYDGSFLYADVTEWAPYTLITPFALGTDENLLVLVETSPAAGGDPYGSGGGETHNHFMSTGMSAYRLQDVDPPAELDAVSLSTCIKLTFGPLPVQLVSFAASTEANTTVLKWRTLSETNNYGFYVQSRVSPEAEFADVPGAFIPGHGTTTEPRDYSWTVSSAARDTWFRLKQVDLDGSTTYSEAVSVTVSSVDESLPLSFSLEQNYPNPFNPTTSIRYGVGVVSREGVVAARVRLAVYDLLGREVAVLVNAPMAPGEYTVEFNAAGLASGSYIYRLQADGFVQTRNLMLMK